MRKLIATLYTGYCGSDGHEAFAVEDGTSESEISEDLYWMAVQHAESYGIYPYPECEEDMDEDTEYTSSIEASWEEYDPEKHDRYRAGGGSFESDF